MFSRSSDHAGATFAHGTAIVTPFVVKIKYKTENSGLEGPPATSNAKSD